MIPALAALVALACLQAGARAAVHGPQTVFLDRQQASSLVSRQKRQADAGRPSTLEQACMERVCTYEDARRFFPDTYRTDIFWSVYIDGDQCVGNPCKNGALCSDSVGGYDCVCKSGFTGVHCENDQTLCSLEKNTGCSQFCKPGYTSFECSCARGWRLSRTNRTVCEAGTTFPCGKVNNPGRWEDRFASNNATGFKGLSCTSTECPWHALLKSSESTGFCSGVILKENLVLTSAQCARKYSFIQVVVGKRKIDFDTDEQARPVKVVNVHPRYVEGRPENDLAVLELQDPVVFKREVMAACLPERDFAESLLTTPERPAVVTGWKESEQTPTFQGALALNHLAYDNLPRCLETHGNLMSNKMGCTAQRADADCTVSSGSPLLSMHRDVVFLTGVVSRPPGADCRKGFMFQKVSRHLAWIQSFMGSR